MQLLFELYRNTSLESKISKAKFWATFGITLAIYILTSGHTIHWLTNEQHSRDLSESRVQRGKILSTFSADAETASKVVLQHCSLLLLFKLLLLLF